MPTDKQRREAARRHLERQLKRRADREAARKRITLIVSIVGTLVVIAAVVVAIGILGSDDGNKAGASPSTSSQPSTGTSTTPTEATSSPAGASLPPAPAATTYPKAEGPSVSFQGVTVTGATDLKGKPGVTSTAKADPPKLLYKDLVVGKGKAANAQTSTVRVQYVGVLYKGGTKAFDNSWDRGQPTDFPLSNVVPGFTQGIGGNGSDVPPMKVGGRRLIIMPAAMGYGSQSPSADIPANSPLVFVVDLVATT